ncbi:MAG: ribonuclease P protein component [Flavobacteriales bacterium]|nr:ribonuclease P protein component [Flavobacteriales bacterium]
MRETLPKSEILRSKNTIDLLFKSGTALEEKPIKLLYLLFENTTGIEVGFTVPKKCFKKAHQRNLLRRRMKESFRKNKKHILPHLLSKNIQLKIFFIYTSSQTTDYKTIEHKIIVLLQRLIKVV